MPTYEEKMAAEQPEDVAPAPAAAPEIEYKPVANETVPDENPLLAKIRELKANNEQLKIDIDLMRDKLPNTDMCTLEIENEQLKTELASTKALLKKIEEALP